MPSPLDVDRLEDLLEDIRWAETSSKRSSAQSLARLSRPQQEFALQRVRALETDNTACAFQFLTHAYRALSLLQLRDVEAWVIQGLDVYDQSGLSAAVDVFKNVDGFLERARIEDEKAGLRSLLVRYKKEPESEQPASERKGPSDKDRTPFSARKKDKEALPGEFEKQILFHDRPVSPPEDIKQVISSIMLDLGELPPEYLVPAGDGSWKPKGTEEEEEDATAGGLVGTLRRMEVIRANILLELH